MMLGGGGVTLKPINTGLYRWTKRARVRSPRNDACHPMTIPSRKVTSHGKHRTNIANRYTGRTPYLFRCNGHCQRQATQFDRKLIMVPPQPIENRLKRGQWTLNQSICIDLEVVRLCSVFCSTWPSPFAQPRSINTEHRIQVMNHNHLAFCWRSSYYLLSKIFDIRNLAMFIVLKSLASTCKGNASVSRMEQPQSRQSTMVASTATTTRWWPFDLFARWWWSSIAIHFRPVLVSDWECTRINHSRMNGRVQS